MKTIHITRIDEALNNIERWYSNTLLLAKGNSMFGVDEILERKKTRFAEWYFGDGQIFNSFSSFKNIENYYNDLFDTYLNFYEIYNTPVKKGFFSSNKTKRQHELNNTIDILRKKSNRLNREVQSFKNQLLASPLFNNNNEIDNSESKQDLKDTSMFINHEIINHISKKEVNKNKAQEKHIDLDDEIKRILS